MFLHIVEGIGTGAGPLGLCHLVRAWPRTIPQRPTGLDRITPPFILDGLPLEAPGEFCLVEASGPREIEKSHRGGKIAVVSLKVMPSALIAGATRGKRGGG